MTAAWNKLPGRKTAGCVLLGLAVVSVVFACAGAERCLDWMRGDVAIAVVAALALCTSLAVCRKPVLLHLGFALVLAGWAFNAWTGPEDGSLRLRRGQTGRVADAGDLFLEDFAIARWPDTGTVRQYVSRVRALPAAAGAEEQAVAIAVNAPFVFRKGFWDPGWWIYQNSYQEMTNPHTGRPLYFTILLCVKDRGLYVSAAGGVLLLLGALWWALGDFKRRTPPVRGAVCRPLAALYGCAFVGAAVMLVHRAASTGHAPMQNMYEFLMCAAAALPLLTFFFPSDKGFARTLLVDAALQALVLVPVCFFMDGGVKRLMPALQSPLFVPHVGAYVLGYLVLVRAAFGVGERLVGFGFFALTLGLVLGATWGKLCWGHWWQFDPKETWSLATWATYAAYFHLRPRLSTRGERIFLAAGAVLIVLTLTWINLSRLFVGMHSYA